MVDAIGNFTDLQSIRIGFCSGLHSTNRLSKNNSLVDWHHSSRDEYPAAGGDELPQLDISYDLRPAVSAIETAIIRFRTCLGIRNVNNSRKFAACFLFLFTSALLSSTSIDSSASRSKRRFISLLFCRE